GFGDAVEPGVADLELPVLLDLPSPRLRAYSRETVIAEKFQAMVMLGRSNSRMKDFYDIWMLSRSYEFDPDRLAQAIAATFNRRKTPIPTALPDALTRAFAEDPAKQKQWASFIESIEMKSDSLPDVVEALAAFLMPHTVEASRRGG
ncbi:nucleotidyl transferase AbiEii/AbiGii toxin family protein, partial [Vineibacter terrae]|uniref:nucleotidyl transferase AbiEii/AbiGii toxin family protein n=1 Tax=Vineibacter terrae TaxID=2586908 RepID=UPI002E34D02D